MFQNGKNLYFSLKNIYNFSIKKNPIIIKSITAGLMFCGGDLICQLIEKKEEWDYKRTIRMTIFGTTILGVIGSRWYDWLDSKYFEKNWSHIFKKVAFDQFIFAPPFYASFYLSMSLMEGKSFGHSIENIKKNFLPTYCVDLMFWPAAQTFNFKVLSPQNRILFISFLSIGWNAFLSHMQHRSSSFLLLSPPNNHQKNR